MDLIVFLAVLAGAAMHAGWNALVKTGLDRTTSIFLLAFIQGLICLVLLPFFAIPSALSWPWIAVSALLHSGYKIFLIRAYEQGIEKIDELKGQAFNIGGGPDNTLSIWSEFGPLLAELSGHEIPVQWGDWRPGDQRVFIADIRKAGARLGWQPTISPTAGIRDLYAWVAANPALF